MTKVEQNHRVAPSYLGVVMLKTTTVKNDSLWSVQKL